MKMKFDERRRRDPCRLNLASLVPHIIRSTVVGATLWLTAAIVYTASAQPARHGNTSRPKKLRKLRGRV